MDPTIAQKETLALLHTLVAIPSVNRSLVADATGESAIATFCSQWLERRGFQVHWLEAEPGSPTVVAVAPGTGGGRTLLINGHLDTVGVQTYVGDPFRTVIDEDRVYGRGTFDMKGSLAAMLVAAAPDATDPLRGTVVLTLVSDEEFGSQGSEEALRFIAAETTLRIDGAIVAEPSGLELTLAHRGFDWFGLELVGKAAHGSQPELGIDAIAGAAALLPAVQRWGRALSEGPRHSLVGTGTVRVSTIVGGVDAATVAPSCQLTIERRTLPGEDSEVVEMELRTMIRETLAATPQLEWTLTRLVGRPAFEANPHSDVVRAVRRAASAQRHAPVPVRGEPFWTDAALFAQAGIECVVFGVDGGGAHADREWVTVDSLYAMTTILSDTIRDFCG